MKKHILTGVVSVCAVLALTATPALATVVKEPGHKFSVSLASAGAVFTPNNGAATTAAITCTASTSSGEVPPATNNEISGTNGAVVTPLSAPTFTSCTSPALTGIVVKTVAGWKFDWLHFTTPATELTGAIAVPSNGAVITDTQGCEITISPSEASPVEGRYTNGTNSTTAPSTFIINSQVEAGFSAGCPAGIASPATFVATYNIKDTTNTADAVTE